MAEHGHRTDVVGPEGLQAQATDGRLRLYLIGSELKAGRAVKVGVTRNLPERLARLQSGSPLPLVVFAAIPGSFKLEKRVHEEWRRQRLHGEWFRLTPKMCSIIAAMESR